jgi:hypothetical protein
MRVYDDAVGREHTRVPVHEVHVVRNDEVHLAPRRAQLRAQLGPRALGVRSAAPAFALELLREMNAKVRRLDREPAVAGNDLRLRARRIPERAADDGDERKSLQGRFSVLKYASSPSTIACA